MNIFDCCDCCDCVLNDRELANEDASRRQWGRLLCFECTSEHEADALSRLTPAGGES